MTAGVVFVDCETTGLDPERHEVWEAAVILDPPVVSTFDRVETREWKLPVDLARADPAALKVGRFHDRFPPWPLRAALTQLDVFAREFAELTRGRVLVGANPTFDVRFLDPLLRRHGQLPEWHYRPVCVEALAVGYLAGKNPGYHGGPHGIHSWLPWRSDDLLRALGISVSDEAKHTALGDARWARMVYEHVMGLREAEVVDDERKSAG